jgi:hypothetical protein
MARKDLSEISDEELMDMIYAVGSQVGPVAKTVGSNVKPFSLIERE